MALQEQLQATAADLLPTKAFGNCGPLQKIDPAAYPLQSEMKGSRDALRWLIMGLGQKWKEIITVLMRSAADDNEMRLLD